MDKNVHTQKCPKCPLKNVQVCPQKNKKRPNFFPFFYYSQRDEELSFNPLVLSAKNAKMHKNEKNISMIQYLWNTDDIN